LRSGSNAKMLQCSISLDQRRKGCTKQFPRRNKPLKSLVSTVGAEAVSGNREKRQADL
jgi:hypothetical protein